MGIVKQDKSIIPALDVEGIARMKEIVSATAGVKGIGAYKVGFELAIPYGLKKIVQEIRRLSDKPVIYDHQKAATDIPETGKKFAQACRQSGVDAVILFPQAGPETEAAWIKAVQEEGLGLIVGGEMTHQAYLKKDGGFLSDDAPKRMYEIACDLGVKDFVVPGNKPKKILEYKKLFERKGVDATLYSPGLVAQGGKITDSGKAAGKKWHAIVGRGIYQAEDVKKAAEELAKELR